MAAKSGKSSARKSGAAKSRTTKSGATKSAKTSKSKAGKGTTTAKRTGARALSAKERTALEAKARELRRRLSGKLSAAQRRNCLAQLVMIEKRLKGSGGGAAPGSQGSTRMKSGRKAAKKAVAKSKGKAKAATPKSAAPKAAAPRPKGKKKTARKAAAPGSLEVAPKSAADVPGAPTPPVPLPAEPSRSFDIRNPAFPAPRDLFGRRGPVFRDQEALKRFNFPEPASDRRGRTARAAPPLKAPPPIAADVGAAAAPAEKIRRTPHMDLPAETLKPDTKFEVLVYVDQHAALPGEDTIDVVAEVGSLVEVQLVVSEHFSVNGSAMTQMTVTDAPRSDADRRFSVSVRPKAELPVDVVPSLIALFFYKGRPSGKVSRAVRIEGVTTQASPPSADRVELSDGTAADLTVVVTGAQIRDGRQFFCTVKSRLLDKYKIGVSEPWNLPEAAESIVLSLMDRFTADATTSNMLLAELRGAGRQLYDASPRIFQQAFWDLIDAGHAIKTIAIITEEPFIPWELMTPYRRKDGHRDLRGALGAEFLIGRWPTPNGIAPAQKIPLRDSFVIAPKYTPPLSSALAEARLVADSLAGEIIEPADFNGIEQKLGSTGKTLVHFVCHGEDEETDIGAIKSDDAQKKNRNRVQIIRLENGQTLNSTQILGMNGVDVVFEEKHPFVFLNACEIGRAVPALIGIGGFAKSFIDLGASAVIAPLWSVKDTIAGKIAEVFYQRIKAEPNTPFAEILRDLRVKAYEPGHAEDTYAAYCFYGDPAAIRTTDG